MRPRKVPGRKLLVASIGVAAVSYVACSSSSEVGGNAGADAGSHDAAADAFQSSGNLAPPPPHDAGMDSDISDALQVFETSGNLAPPPPDAHGD
jgi:hypothetical protein